MTLAGLRTFPGIERVLAVQGAALPQPDHLCGPYAGRAALHAVLDDVASLLDLALASGTSVWPEDDGASLPPGAVPHRLGWDRLPRAATESQGGTSAAGLTAGLEAAGAAVTPVPDPGSAAALGALLEAIGTPPVAVIANLRTGPVLPPGVEGWDVGHFVVLWGIGPGPDGGVVVGIADSYPQLGRPGLPPGCRVVALDALLAGLAAAPGRGLLLLSRPVDRDAVRALVEDAGLAVGGWD